MDKKKLRKIIKESFEDRHIGYRRFFPLDIKPDPMFSIETKPEQLDEGSDGNYMPKQNIESILKSAEIVNSHIEHDIEQEDWVEDKLSKTAENMRALRDFFENKSEEIEEGGGRSFTIEKGKNIKPNIKDDEIDEGIGISHTMKRGMNAKPKKKNKSKNPKRK